MGLLEDMKSDIQNVGGNKGKFFYAREGDRKRIRFLQEIPVGFKVAFHNRYGETSQDTINVPCQKQYGRKCGYCDDSSLKNRPMYAWSVWDYEANEVKIFMYAANRNSPVPSVISMYETYGTILDRDYMITVAGKGTNRTFSVVPMDKEKFRNSKAKPYSHDAFMKLLDAAYPDTIYGGSKENKHDAMDDFEDAMNEPEGESKYDGKDAKALFKLCKERGIEVEPKKPAAYYKNLLEEQDKAEDDWADEEEEGDEWEEK